MRILRLRIPGVGEEAARTRVWSGPRRLHPWVRSLLGGNPDEVRASLRRRWSRLAHPALREFRETLIGCEPVEIVVTRDTEFVVLAPRRRGIDEDVEERWYVPPPCGPEVVRRLVRAAGLPQSGLFAAFLVNFGGLAEQPPGCAGTGEQLCPLYVELGPKGWPQWADAFGIYHAVNGNFALLRRRTGAVAWAYHPAEPRVRRVAPDLAGFLRYVVRYKARHRGWPLDAYGP